MGLSSNYKPNDSRHYNPGEDDAAAPAEGEGEGSDESVTMLIMTLMDVDGEIKA